MEGFGYDSGALYCERLRVREIARQCGTPCFIYSRSAFLSRYGQMSEAFADLAELICYSVKSCSNLSLLRLLARAGSGFDVVSGGELFRVIRAGGDPRRVVYAGVGKTEEEMHYALDQGVFMFNVESLPELETLNRVAAGLGKRARAALRLNPDVDAGTHAKTTTGKKENKFGIGLRTASEIFARQTDFGAVDLCGVHLHLGSPIYSPEPYSRAIERIRDTVEAARSAGADIRYLNIGGGYCISYTGEEVIGPADYAAAVREPVRKTGCRLILEPGRYVSGSSGILVVKVLYRKQTEHGKVFVICDGAMNDLIRPTLYDANHRVWPVSTDVPLPEVLKPGDVPDGTSGVVDVVGPICESGDYLAVNAALPMVDAGDYLAVFDAGAYGFSMSSNYNSRPRSCEVLVTGSEFSIIRQRETYDSLVRGEQECLVGGD